MVDTPVALTPQTGRLPARDARDSGNVLPGGGAGCRRRSKRLIRWALPSVLASGEAKGLRGDGGSVRWMLTGPASWGEDGRSRAGCPDPAGIPGTGYGRARTGAVCARDGARPGTAGSGLPGPMLARSVRGHRFQGSGV